MYIRMWKNLPKNNITLELMYTSKSQSLTCFLITFTCMRIKMPSLGTDFEKYK